MFRSKKDCTVVRSLREIGELYSSIEQTGSVVTTLSTVGMTIVKPMSTFIEDAVDPLSAAVIAAVQWSEDTFYTS